MFVLGISGGIGCGKSTVADYFRRRGVEVLDADALSHEMTAKGGAALPDLIELFGSEILDAEGNMDRKKMADRSFRDRKVLDLLSGLIHQKVMDEIQKTIERAKRKKRKLVVLDVPIPVQRGFLDKCNAVLIVWAKDEVRKARLIARGMKLDDIERRMELQMSKEEYLALSTHTLDNSGSLAELDRQLDAFYEAELVTRGIRLEVRDA